MGQPQTSFHTTLGWRQRCLGTPSTWGLHPQHPLNSRLESLTLAVGGGRSTVCSGSSPSVAPGIQWCHPLQNSQPMWKPQRVRGHTHAGPRGIPSTKAQPMGRLLGLCPRPWGFVSPLPSLEEQLLLRWVGSRRPVF